MKLEDKKKDMIIYVQKIGQKITNLRTNENSEEVEEIILNINNLIDKIFGM